MVIKKIEVKPKTSFISKFHSDTFFGEFCRYASFLFGKEFLYKKIGLEQRKANIAFSNPLPKDTFPIPKLWIAQILKNFEIDNEKDYDYLKKFKKLKILPQQKFKEIYEILKEALGNINEAILVIKDIIDNYKSLGIKTEKISNLHVAINRKNFMALEGALYELEEIYYLNGTSLYVYMIYDETKLDEDEIVKILKILSIDGFGAKKSWGKGSFDFKILELNEIEKEFLIKKRKEANYIVSLSVGFPLKNEVEEDGSYFETFTTFPKHGPDAIDSGIFKIPLLMANLGSTFKIKEKLEIYGDITRVSGFDQAENREYKYKHSRMIVPLYL